MAVEKSCSCYMRNKVKLDKVKLYFAFYEISLMFV